MVNETLSRPAIGSLFDERSKHATPRPELVKARSYGTVTAIVLHQTACTLGEKPERWYGVPVHFGVTKSGKILYLNDMTLNVPHGNGFNGRSVGIEIDGAYAGIEGDLSTFWRPAGSKCQPDVISEQQLGAARVAVRFIVDEVARHGGKIQYIFAHRQSSKDRISDPGSRIWQEVGLWAQRELGLSDGGEGFQQGGYPIPEAWDPTRRARY